MSVDQQSRLSRAARVLLFATRVYQAFFSALMPSACKFYPSCSHYAAEVVRIHGARRGSWLAIKRLSRCHPFTKGGADLVPDAASDVAADHTMIDDSIQENSGREVRS